MNINLTDITKNIGNIIAKIKNNNELNGNGIKSDGIDSGKTKWPVKGGIVCGIVLCTAMALQQYGISIYPDGVAASGRAGFLTATYVVMVAVFSVFLGKKLHVSVIISTIVCVIGMYLLCLSGGISGIYMGNSICCTDKWGRACGNFYVQCKPLICRCNISLYSDSSNEPDKQEEK